MQIIHWFPFDVPFKTGWTNGCPGETLSNRLLGNVKHTLELRWRDWERKTTASTALERAGNRTRLMYYDRQEPTTLFNVVPLGRLWCKHLSHPLGASLPTTGGGESCRPAAKHDICWRGPLNPSRWHLWNSLSSPVPGSGRVPARGPGEE